MYQALLQTLGTRWRTQQTNRGRAISHQQIPPALAVADAREKNSRELESAWTGRVGVLGRAVRAGRPRKVTLNWDLQSEQEPTRQQLGRRLWTGPGLVFSKRGWKASVAGTRGRRKRRSQRGRW